MPRINGWEFTTDKKVKIVTGIVRIIISAVLLYGVYQETGIFTFISLALILAVFELRGIA